MILHCLKIWVEVESLYSEFWLTKRKMKMNDKNDGSLVGDVDRDLSRLMDGVRKSKVAGKATKIIAVIALLNILGFTALVSIVFGVGKLFGVWR